MVLVEVRRGAKYRARVWLWLAVPTLFACSPASNSPSGEDVSPAPKSVDTADLVEAALDSMPNEPPTEPERVPTTNTVVSFRHEVHADMREDGRPLTFIVDVTGPDYLHMVGTLQVRSATDSLLFQRRVHSAGAFYGEDLETMPDSTIRYTVMNHLSDLLGARAFTRHVDYCAGADWTIEDGARDALAGRNSLGLTPGAPWGTPSDAPEASVQRVVAEVKAAPQYHAYLGGDHFEAIAWSNTAGRFVITCSCC